jgi:hypothetical protein
MIPLSMLQDNINDVFSPLIVIQASKQATLSFNMNCLTPAEAFSTFGDFNKPFEMKISEKEQKSAMVKPTIIRFLDIEELEVQTEAVCRENIEFAIKNTKPEIDKLEKIDFDVSKRDQCQKFLTQVRYPWFKTIIGHYISSIKADLNGIKADLKNSFLSQPIAVISMVSACSPDPAEELKKLNQEHEQRLKTVFNCSKDELEKIIFRITILVIDTKRKPMTDTN